MAQTLIEALNGFESKLNDIISRNGLDVPVVASDAYRFTDDGFGSYGNRLRYSKGKPEYTLRGHAENLCRGYLDFITIMTNAVNYPTNSMVSYNPIINYFMHDRDKVKEKDKKHLRAILTYSDTLGSEFGMPVILDDLTYAIAKAYLDFLNQVKADPLLREVNAVNEYYLFPATHTTHKLIKSRIIKGYLSTQTKPADAPTKTFDETLVELSRRVSEYERSLDRSAQASVSVATSTSFIKSGAGGDLSPPNLSAGVPTAKSGGSTLSKLGRRVSSMFSREVPSTLSASGASIQNSERSDAETLKQITASLTNIYDRTDISVANKIKQTYVLENLFIEEFNKLNYPLSTTISGLVDTLNQSFTDKKKSLKTQEYQKLYDKYFDTNGCFALSQSYFDYATACIQYMYNVLVSLFFGSPYAASDLDVRVNLATKMQTLIDSSDLVDSPNFVTQENALIEAIATAESEPRAASFKRVLANLKEECSAIQFTPTQLAGTGLRNSAGSD